MRFDVGVVSGKALDAVGIHIDCSRNHWSHDNAFGILHGSQSVGLVTVKMRQLHVVESSESYQVYLNG